MAAVGASNSLQFILGYFKIKKQQYRILFDVLNNYLSSYSSDKVTIEEKAYKILCQTIMDSSISGKIGEELI